ncbi:MAG: ATP-dependent Clp protease ATP-binding subunit [Clostridia bacterium]|nr:ATP-dependent Clp protease ATP-binding subunit [Clostridia bacterium]
MLCVKCKKRTAVVFVSRLDGENKPVNEGYCLKCAKDMGIPQVNEIIKGMGMTDEDLEQFADEFDQMSEQLGLSGDGLDSQTAPSLPPFFSKMFGAGNKPAGEAHAEKEPNGKKKEKEKKRKMLDQFGVNLTAKARKGELDPVVGRQIELNRLIRILNRRTKNNPCLIGEPGVGKTAIAEELASKIAKEDVPAKLLGKEVYLLDLTALVAGTQFRGQFESRIKNLITEVVELGNIILVIDEIHNLVGTGDAEGTMNAANILKPALSRGEIQVIGATTLAEYRKYIEKDAALERRFQPVMVEEPSLEDTVEILKGLRPRYSAYHHVLIPDQLLVQAAQMSERYITDRFLPDKAIDLLDEACSGASLENVAQNDLIRKQRRLTEIEARLNVLSEEEQGEEIYKEQAELNSEKFQIESALKEMGAPKDAVLTFDHLAYVLELWTGIPASKIKQQEFEKLNQLENVLKARIVGQDEAIDSVVRAIKRRRVGVSLSHSPASFIFTGPTGVGKTELVRQLSIALFDSVEALIRVDMSEYMEKHSVSKLIGAPPGYVGYDDAGQLTEKVRRKPYSVILFDEIEKAHPEVLNIMLQMLDDGKLTDAQGRVVNFENTIIVMTTNATADTANATGFNRSESELEKDRATRALLKFLRPEFINRVDEIITFHPLERETIRSIADIMMGDLRKSLELRSITLEMEPAVLDHLAEHGYDRKFGARSLKRTIQREVEDQIAQQMIDHFDQETSAVRCYVSDGKICVDLH